MTAPRLAWGLFGVWVALAVLAAYYSIRSKEEFEGLFMLGLTVFAVVGAVVASRQPRNPIGWILQAVVLFSALTSVLIGYTSTADEPAEVAVWLDDWIADVWIGLVAVGIPLLFPDGHLPSPRWRPAAWLATGLFTLGIAGRALGDRVLDTEAPGTWENPYALPGVAGDVMADIASVSVVFYGVPALIGVAGLVVRMRRSHGVERQQLKWFAYVGAAAAGGADPVRDQPDRPRPLLRRGDRLDQLPRPRHVRPAARHRRGDPAPPPLRHRRRHQPHAGLRRADGDARRDVPGARAADRADARHVEPRDRGLDARGGGAVPPGAGAHPGGRRPALLPPPLRRGAHARGVRRAGCATSSTSTRSAPTCATWCATPCSPPMSRCG